MSTAVQPEGEFIIANFWDQQADTVAVLRIAEARRDAAIDPVKRHRLDEIVSAIRAEYGLPEGAA